MECLDETSPVDIEEGVKDIKDDNNEKNYWGKEAECLDDNSPDDMEECVSDRKYDKNE